MTFATIDLTPQIDRLPRRQGHVVLPPRERHESITFHYSAVEQKDRSRDAELATLLSEARYHLQKNWAKKGAPPVYGDGPMYDIAVISDGTRVILRRRPQQLWHCGNSEGNASSIAVHSPLGPGQDLTEPQRESLFLLFDELRAEFDIPQSAVYGHNEWPRGEGAPRPAAIYRLLPSQSECPGDVLHRHLVAYRVIGRGATLAPAAAEAYSEHSPVLGPTRATLAQALAFILARPHGEYTRADFERFILPAYLEQCAAAGIPFELAVAQAIHETGCFSSALSQRKDRDGRDLRNPAGIGVWEAKDKATKHHRPGTVYDADVQGYRPACQFKDWARESVPAHVGRLLAYALPLEAPTSPAQAALLTYADQVRDYPDHGRGSALTLRELGKAHNRQSARGMGWASPGTDYGAKIARIANAICQVQL